MVFTNIRISQMVRRHLPARRHPSSVNRSVGHLGANYEANRNLFIQGLGTLPGPIQNHVAPLAARAGYITQQGYIKMKGTHPPKTWDGVLALLPRPIIDNIWTNEKEEQFQAGFAADPYRLFLETAPSFPASDRSYWAMWRTLYRLRNCFPTDIIGAKNQLKYAEEVDVGGGIMKPNPRWSPRFCHQLTQLALGSPCGANMGMLALLIRYTVADRLDDRRKMSFEGHKTKDGFFADLGALVQRENDTRSLRDLHAQVRRD